MKTRLLTLFAGLLTCLTASTFGLSGDLAGKAQALERVGELNMQLNAALQEDDASALASLFTDDGVCVTPQGVLTGRSAIVEGLENAFKGPLMTSQAFQIDQLHSIGVDAWSVGQWWTTFQESSGAIFLNGYWSAVFVHDGEAWKIRMLTLSEVSRHGPGSFVRSE
jgi:uncharacterized protein (TIGR02246 family)